MAKKKIKIREIIVPKNATKRENANPASGRILLQTEGFELFVRKFEIDPLKK